MTDNTEGRPSIVISGSFRRYYNGIRDAIKQFESLGVEVLSPMHSNVVNPGEDFVILETDESTCPDKLEREHLMAICRADALYLYNPDGYIGPSSAMEVGWALALRKPVYARESCEDATLQYFAREIAAPEEIKNQLVGRQNDRKNRLDPELSLRDLQSYVQKVVNKRGFAAEVPRDKVLLMLEEFGELAKALRKYTGLKIDEDRKERYTEMRYELADILFYLLDLANTCGIDLFEAFQEKERENASRKWGKV